LFAEGIYFLVAPHGGIRPAERRRSRLALTIAEREVISRGVTADQSARSIARLLGRSPSTVSREMSRNGGCDRYRAALADENAWARAHRPFDMENWPVVEERVRRLLFEGPKTLGVFRNFRISTRPTGCRIYGKSSVRRLA
jgi:DNA-binding CsgD family transcriptional regulator